MFREDANKRSYKKNLGIAIFLALVAGMVVHSSKFINAKCGYLHTISYLSGIRCADPSECDRCNP
jgi:hypothetical protein